MDFLKQWSFCVCVSLVLSVILSLFSPRGNMNRFYKILISFFIFISFIYPLKNMNFRDIKLKEESGFSSLETGEDEMYQNMINDKVKTYLKSKHVDGAVVQSDVDVGAGGEINVKSVKVAVGGEYDKERVKNMIFDSLGINAEVIENGE